MAIRRLEDTCPIPLIGRNQAGSPRALRRRSPENLSGAVYLALGHEDLYVALDLLDQVHYLSGDGETVIEGDSLILAFDPTSLDRPATQSLLIIFRRKAPGAAASTRCGGPANTPGADPTATWWATFRFMRSPSRPRGPGASMSFESLERAGDFPILRREVGFSIQSNDNDGDGLAAQMSWGDSRDNMVAEQFRCRHAD